MKRLLFILLLYSSAAMAQVSYDTFAFGTCNATNCDASSSNTLTVTITVAANSNRALAVGIGISGPSGVSQPAVSTVTCGGTALSQLIHHEFAAGVYYIDIWTLANGVQPGTGAVSCVVVLASNLNANGLSYMSVGIISAYNVGSPTWVTSSATGAHGTGTAANLTLGGSDANGLVVDFICGGTDGTFSQSFGTTINKNANNANACATFVIARAVGGTTVLNWTIPSDNWINTGASFKPAAGGVNCTMALLGVGRC